MRVPTYILASLIALAGCGEERGRGGTGDGGTGGGGGPRNLPPACDVTAPPSGFDAIYTRYLNCKTIAIVATVGVDDEALLVADDTIEFMLTGNDDGAARLRAAGYYYILRGRDVTITELPVPGFSNASPTFNGYANDDAATSSGQEVLCKLEDIEHETNFFEANVLVHEFTHSIQFVGLERSKVDEIRQAYDSARRAGLWDNTYAGTNFEEYFAELTQIWFEVGRVRGPEAGDGTRNHIVTRDELAAYDPAGHALIGSIFNSSFDVPGCIQRNAVRPWIDPNETCDETVTDVDGNVYPVARVGNQCWMARNLETTRFRNEVPVPEVADAAEWSSATAPAHSAYDNDPSYVPTRGRLYNHAAALAPDGLCPDGMRLPTLDDYRQLRRFATYADRERPVPPRLSAGSEWTEATDDYGFGALPSGRRTADGNFSGLRLDPIDLRWSAWLADDDADDQSLGTSFDIIDGFGDLITFPVDKRSGFSVRCMGE